MRSGKRARRGIIGRGDRRKGARELLGTQRPLENGWRQSSDVSWGFCFVWGPHRLTHKHAREAPYPLYHLSSPERGCVLDTQGRVRKKKARGRRCREGEKFKTLGKEEEVERNKVGGSDADLRP